VRGRTSRTTGNAQRGTGLFGLGTKRAAGKGWGRSSAGRGRGRSSAGGGGLSGLLGAFGGRH
jgi:hypothetical protein